jgi:beta-aspartyl-peptidase (threonine type)
MLAGPGADAFAAEQGLEIRDPSWFVTERRWNDLLKARAREARGVDRPNTVDAADPAPFGRASSPPTPDKLGTVGAVALDAGGLLVAGTSTGGMANKKWGRVGDSPIIGAGTYAGSHCGVSCTGWGEYFIRNAVAHDIQARMAYLGVSLEEAVRQVVLDKLEAQRKGLGGVVAMDREGNGRMGFNTRGMYRGWVGEDGRVRVAVYEEPTA